MVWELTQFYLSLQAWIKRTWVGVLNMPEYLFFIEATKCQMHLAFGYGKTNFYDEILNLVNMWNFFLASITSCETKP